MPAKRDLGAALGKNVPKPEIQRGSPFQLSPGVEEGTSTSTNDTRTSAQTHKRTEAPVIKRTSQGQRLRVDLMREMKRIAFEDERKLYEVMEEAMEQYIAWRKETPE
jgi:hypothetical protein